MVDPTKIISKETNIEKASIPIVEVKDSYKPEIEYIKELYDLDIETRPERQTLVNRVEKNNEAETINVVSELSSSELPSPKLDKKINSFLDLPKKLFVFLLKLLQLIVALFQSIKINF